MFEVQEEEKKIFRMSTRSVLLYDGLETAHAQSLTVSKTAIVGSTSTPIQNRLVGKAKLEITPVAGQRSLRTTMGRQWDGTEQWESLVDSLSGVDGNDLANLLTTPANCRFDADSDIEVSLESSFCDLKVHVFSTRGRDRAIVTLPSP